MTARSAAGEQNLVLGVFLRLVLAGLASLATYGVPIVVALYSRGGGIVCGVVLTVLLTVLLIGTYPPAYLCYWITLAIFQNFLAALWVNPNGTTDVPAIITESKTISMVVAALLLLRGISEVVGSARRARLGLVVLSLGLIINFRQPNLAAFATLRNFALPTLILLVGLTIARDMSLRTRVATIRGVLYFITICLTAGSFAELVVGTETWRSIFRTGSLSGLNSLSQTTYFFGIRFDREGGILFEPIDAGYVAASIIVGIILVRMASRADRNTFDWFVLFGALFVLAAAATKDGLLMFLLLGVGVSQLKRGVSPQRMVFTAMLLAWFTTYVYLIATRGPAEIVGIFTDPIALAGGDSASLHMAGLMSGLTAVITNPIGHALGSGGNFQELLSANALSGRAWLSTGAESSWGTLAYQAGLLGLIGLLITIAALANHLMRGVGAIAIGVWAAAALFAESLFGPIDACVLLVTGALLTTQGMVSGVPKPASADA